MLKTIFLPLLFIASTTFAQQWAGSGSTNNNIYRVGDLTVVNGSMTRVTLGPAWGSAELGGRGYVGLNLRRENTGLWSYLGDGAMNDGVAIVHAWNSLVFSMKTSTGTSGGSLTDADIANNIVMRVGADGKVIIGKSWGNNATFTSFPGNYKLYVQSGILTEKVRVAVHGTASWADYVFQPDYELMSLTDLQEYVTQYKHLPNIPSANEVVREGIDLGEMNAKLLQKIEELTLYVIQQQQQIDELKTKVK